MAVEQVHGFPPNRLKSTFRLGSVTSDRPDINLFALISQAGFENIFSLWLTEKNFQDSYPLVEARHVQNRQT
jgi:hypothetical protein